MRGISVAVIVSALVSRRHPEVRRIHQRAEESRAGLIENRSRANTLGWGFHGRKHQRIALLV